MLDSLDRWRSRLAVIASLGTVLSCADNATGPASSMPPYIGIVTKIDALPGVSVGSAYTYRIRELSGTLDIDTLITVAPNDTVFYPVPPATYVVTVENVPANCGIREGADQSIFVPEKTNTSVIRYSISCQPLLTLTTTSEGRLADSTFVFAVSYGGHVARVGLLGANDTLMVDSLPEGDATVELADVAGNCVVTNDGGARQAIHMTPRGGFRADYRIICSERDERPTIVRFVPTYHDGAAGMLFQATDPDRDIAKYMWDLTDCHQRSLLPNGARERSGLTGGRTAGLDTVTVLGAFEVGWPDAEMAGNCASLRVSDDRGNTTPVLEVPLVVGGPAGPAPISYSARFNGTALLQTQLVYADPSRTLGSVVIYRLRDGTIGPPDGREDPVSRGVAGFLGAYVPDFAVEDAGLSYDGFVSVITYLFDSAGRFTRLEDFDLFQ